MTTTETETFERARAPWYRRPALVTLLPAALVAAAYLVNSKGSYDFSLDELTYASVTQQVLDRNAITTGASPFLVHPPLYFLLGALWNAITGNAGDGPLQALYSLRHLQAVLVGVVAWTAGLVTSAALRSAGVRVRLWQPVATMAVFALSGFVLLYGRAVILETTALLAGTLIGLAALRLRESTGVLQICVLGAMIGTGCLVKQTVIFAGLAPLLAWLVRRDWRQVRIQLGAIVVGALVWCSFLLWGVTQGHASAFVDQQTVSFRRLVGVLQTSGVNKAKPSGTATLADDLKATFWQYLAGYVVFVAGALALLVLLVHRRLLSRTEPLPFAHHLLLAFGVLQYLFVTFSFLFGQGNEQLIMYSAPAAAIATVYVLAVPDVRRGLGRAVRPLVALVAAAGVVVGAGTWVHYYVTGDDDGTTRMAAYISRVEPGCVGVNASGNPERWQAVLPAKAVTGFSSTAGALDEGNRLFVVSTKDAAHAYGNMSPQFARDIAEQGTLLHKVFSRGYGTIYLFRIGSPEQVRAEPDRCVAQSPPRVRASAIVFGSLLGGALVIVGIAALAASRRRTRPRHEAS